jgi:hypothetical protein
MKNFNSVNYLPTYNEKIKSRHIKGLFPPIKHRPGISNSLNESTWKFVGTSSPLSKQISINSAIKTRKANVVRNLKRNLKILTVISAAIIKK